MSWRKFRSIEGEEIMKSAEDRFLAIAIFRTAAFRSSDFTSASWGVS
jgi:hypothetical protein